MLSQMPRFPSFYGWIVFYCNNIPHNQNSMEVPQKVKNRNTLWPSSCTKYLPKDTKIWIRRNTCTPMFKAALSTTAKLWEEPKCPLTDKWIKVCVCTYIMEFYLAIKKNEILPFATTWIELECIMLSETSQRKTNTIWFLSCGI